MSVLCCRIPNFLVALACRKHPALKERPLALLGPDDCIWALSPEAQKYGVRISMRPQEAQIHCPSLFIRDLELAACEAEQSAFLAAAACWELPVERQTWGTVYVDLHAVSKDSQQVQPLAVELGRRVRSMFGESMQPSLGWDSGKFTANAAAAQTAPGRIRLVDKTDELRFLQPLPVTLLPLPQTHLRELHWLGVRTLGQFAALPSTAVWQRFGAAGKLAHRLAKGHDDRPVRSTAPEAGAVTTVTIDPPTGLLQPVVDAVMTGVQSMLTRLSEALVGLRHLRIKLNFVRAAPQSIDVTLVEPTSEVHRVQAALVQRLCALHWPGRVESLEWQILSTGELVAQQPTLFAELSPAPPSLDALADGLMESYGSYLFSGQVVEQSHPIAERRNCLRMLTAVH